MAIKRSRLLSRKGFPAFLVGGHVRVDQSCNRDLGSELRLVDGRQTEMTLLNLILNIYERWQDRRRFGKLEPLDHYCVHRVLENGDKISYMMKYDPQTTKRGQPPTETSQ